MDTKFIVLDLCNSIKNQTSKGLGAMYVEWELRNRKIKLEIDIEKADIVLMSSVSCSDVTKIRTLKKEYPWKIYILGGAASLSPLIFMDVCDYICVGDGQKFMNLLCKSGVKELLTLSNVLHKNKTNAEIDYNFPFDMPLMQAQDMKYRVYCGRGCKKKCSFCQTGWGLKYNENPDSKLLKKQITILNKQNKKYLYLSNDLTQHTFFNDLIQTGVSSVSYDYVKKNGIPKDRTLRFGIEGVSERLRKFIYKPIPMNGLIDMTINLNKLGKGIRWFLICGLPTEDKEDWDELKQTILEWKKHTIKGTLELSFAAWAPQPATPLSYFGTTDEYWDNFENFYNWFLHGKGYSNRLKIKKPQMPKNRDKFASYFMGDMESVKTIGILSKNRKILAYPHKDKFDKILKNYKGITS